MFQGMMQGHSVIIHRTTNEPHTRSTHRRVSESDAKEAYEHMARCGIGAKAAAFYLHYAAFEEGCGACFFMRSTPE